MTQIILTPEQSAILGSATSPVVVVDSQGRQFFVNSTPSAWTAAELAEMESRIDSDEPRVPSSEVLARLRPWSNGRAIHGDIALVAVSGRDDSGGDAGMV